MILRARRSRLAILMTTVLVSGLVAPMAAWAAPSLVVDAQTGRVLHQQEATAVWYPASLTKLMTVYVALQAVKQNQISLSTPLVVSMRAARMAPSKMGFRPGTQVTLDNALKMLMVKSANDIAVTIAEGVSGSVEDFAAQMNKAATGLGLRESFFDNPNGLPDPRQVTSARDMAIIARALYAEFPEQNGLFSIGALQLGNQIIQTHNGLLGRYPGADGMKTGFTCSAGFNIVVSAVRNGRRLIAVVLGAPTVHDRNLKAEELLEAAFAGADPDGPAVTDLASTGGSPADMHDIACTRRGHIQAASEEAEETVANGKAGVVPAETVASLEQAAAGPRHFEPVVVFVGPEAGWTGAAAGAKPLPAVAAQPATVQPATAYAPEKAQDLNGNDAASAANAAAGPKTLSGATSLTIPPKQTVRRLRTKTVRGKPFKRLRLSSRQVTAPSKK